VSAPGPRTASRKPPTGTLDPANTWTATVVTSCGTFRVSLDVEHSPKTASSFASLARSHYFDDTVFHRIVPGFVIQGGDPTATGGGGPGYTVVEPPPAGTVYAHGVVAMAKAPSEPAGASGSQFFVVTTADARLPPDYAVLGKVTSGLAVADRIGTLGDASEQPTKVVLVRRIAVTGS
jgi:peptidyl-prolyl cis-trans isomerase B (cyclophilin B)